MRDLDNGATIDHGELGPDHPLGLASDCRHCQRIAKLTLAFREFGYSSLTTAETREAYHIAMVRKPTAKDGIIAMFISGQLEEAGLIER